MEAEEAAKEKKEGTAGEEVVAGVQAATLALAVQLQAKLQVTRGTRSFSACGASFCDSSPLNPMWSLTLLQAVVMVLTAAAGSPCHSCSLPAAAVDGIRGGCGKQEV